MSLALVTNDDGVHAPGLRVLAACARALFDRVVVVAPAGEMSGAGQSITLHAPLRYSEIEEDVYAVSGTPVDCVLVALAHVLADTPPDIVLSGVNRGPNLGHDVYYSGTVAAAREGVIQGLPAVAFSLVGERRYPFADIAPIVTRILRWTGARPADHEHLLNVNIPCPEPGAAAGLDGVPGVRGLRVTRLGRRFYANEMVVRDDPRGKPYLWIGGAHPEMQDVVGSDCNAVRDGFVSVTPVGIDATAHEALAGLLPLERSGAPNQDPEDPSSPRPTWSTSDGT